MTFLAAILVLTQLGSSFAQSKWSSKEKKTSVSWYLKNHLIFTAFGCSNTLITDQARKMFFDAHNDARRSMAQGKEPNKCGLLPEGKNVYELVQNTIHCTCKRMISEMGLWTGSKGSRMGKRVPELFPDVWFHMGTEHYDLHGNCWSDSDCCCGC